jgi:hypothetical protein
MVLKATLASNESSLEDQWQAEAFPFDSSEAVADARPIAVS